MNRPHPNPPFALGDELHLWRALDANDTEHTLAQAALHGSPQLTVNRRQWLKLMSASLALAGLSGCGKAPEEAILPYVHAPTQGLQGEPRHYATAVLLDGYALPVMATSYMGRPIKLEGNTRHPVSGGATDVLAQAAVLELWDPERSKLLLHNGITAIWEEFLAELERHRPRWRAGQGGALRVLTGTVTSPTLAAQLQDLQEREPGFRWHQYQPINSDQAHAGASLAFGAAVEPRWRLEAAQRIVALDCDFLGPGVGQVNQAHAFMSARRASQRTKAMNRLYMLESSPTLSGANADHHLVLSPAVIQDWVWELARTLGAALSPGPLDGRNRRQVEALAEDLLEHRGRSLVIAGRAQPPTVHALAHWINDRLGNVGQTVRYYTPVQARVEDQLQSLRGLVQDMRAGRVDTLVILGGNPVYDAPVDLGFAAALSQVSLSIHHGLYRDETALRVGWHIPLAHPLERWGDARASDGHATILQPLIEPLYGGHSPHRLLSALAGEPAADSRETVRRIWRRRLGDDHFEQRWRTALRDGLIAGSAVSEQTVQIRTDLAERLSAPASEEGLTLTFTPDATVWDGAFANNAWLQELPKPMTQLTWDNALLISPALADREGLSSGDRVEVRSGQRRLAAAVWIAPGQSDSVITLSLGYGRRKAGRVGNGCGFDAYQLRRSDAFWSVTAVSLRRLPGHHDLATTQAHHGMRGRAPIRRADLAEYLADPQRVVNLREQTESLYPPYRYSGHAWGMFIDLNTCIGCSACTIACQAENNIPVVGKEEVQRGREMHWIRVDRYYEGKAHAPRTYFQPVPCMHCEHAPCELVCPVGATVHDGEGLNVQVYNRCIGTRFCSNNCPYKVRRFNFLQYADQTTAALAARRNPRGHGPPARSDGKMHLLHTTHRARPHPRRTRGPGPARRRDPHRLSAGLSYSGDRVR